MQTVWQQTTIEASTCDNQNDFIGAGQAPKELRSRKGLSINSARHHDSSGGSKNRQESRAFLRAAVHAITRTDPYHSSSASLHSLSASSVPSSVASSQKFQGFRASREIESPRILDKLSLGFTLGSNLGHVTSLLVFINPLIRDCERNT